MWFDFATDFEDEIFHNILRGLPVKSLARFRSVSKLWNYAICHPKFLGRQTSVSFTTHYVDADKEDKEDFNDIDIHKYDSFFELHIYLYDKFKGRLVSIPRDKEPLAGIYGGHRDFPRMNFITNSCHRLVVICMDTSLYLLNPSTNFMIKVLQLNALNSFYVTSSGFCYNDSKNDYKVVLTLKHASLQNNRDFVLVASLKRKSWSSIGPVGFHLPGVDVGPVVNNRLHCIALDLLSSARRVYRFDPKSEIFEEFFIPPPRHTDDKTFSLGVLNDRLALCYKSKTGNKKYGSIEVMVMREYGVLESWTSMFVISNADIMQNLSYGKFTLFADNEEVFIVAGRLKLVAYNPRTDTCRNIDFRVESKGITTNASVCLDVSLVEPKGLEWNKKKHKKLARCIKMM